MNKILRNTKHETHLFAEVLAKTEATKHGFTLIEIITALAIMTIGLLSILALFPVGFHASKRAADFTKVTLFAQGKLEEIKMEGFDNAENEAVSDEGNTDGIFSREVTVSSVSGYDNLKEVTVKVSWSERGQTHEQEFKTYIADYAP